MKAVWIFYDIVLDATILSLLKEVSPGGYTRWPRLTGDGPQSGPRLDDHVWPGANAALLAVRDDASTHLMATALALPCFSLTVSRSPESRHIPSTPPLPFPFSVAPVAVPRHSPS